MSEQEGLLCLAMQLTWCSDTALLLQTRKEDVQQSGDRVFLQNILLGNRLYSEGKQSKNRITCSKKTHSSISRGGSRTLSAQLLPSQAVSWEPETEGNGNCTHSSLPTSDPVTSHSLKSAAGEAKHLLD